eukprot:2418906-Prymnesium_polylepis.1
MTFLNTSSQTLRVGIPPACVWQRVCGGAVWRASAGGMPASSSQGSCLGRRVRARWRMPASAC